MSEVAACPACRSPFPAEAPQGPCPRCRGAGFPAGETAAYQPAPPSMPPPTPPGAEASGAGMVVDLDRFCRSVIDLGLLAADELDPFVQAADGDVLALSRALARAGRLTGY